MSPEEFTFMDEVKLMGYGESDSSGAWIKLQIQPEDLARFRGLRGEIFECSLRQIDNSGQTVKPKVRLRLEAIELCKDEHFQEYLDGTRIYGVPQYRGSSNEENTAWALKGLCGIERRSELDTNPEAARKFADLKTRFFAWKQRR